MDDGDARGKRTQSNQRGFGGKPGDKPPSDKQLQGCTIKESYFWTEEYNKLTHVERYKLWQMRKKCSGGSGERNAGGSGDGRDKGSRQLEELSSQISELQTQLTRQNESEDKDLFISDSEEEEETNKNNHALIPCVCQKVAEPKSASRKSTASKHRKKQEEGLTMTFTNPGP